MYAGAAAQAAGRPERESGRADQRDRLALAAVRGVRSVYPGAGILLHVAGFGYSRDDRAPRAFFRSMVDSGVTFDIAGLSYPYLHAGDEVPQPYFRLSSFGDTLSYLAGLGKRVQIVEFDYPNAPGGMIHPAAPGNPLTPDGQAAFVTDFATGLRGHVEAIQYCATRRARCRGRPASGRTR